MQEIFDLARRGELEPLMKRLTVFASRHMHRLTWRGASLVRGGILPEGYGAPEFAGNAISKALDGTRAWNRDAYPDLELFLRSIIRSDINHLAESLDNVRERRLQTALDADGNEIVYEPPGGEPDPLAVAIDEEWRERYREAVWQEMNGDRLLVDLLRCYEAAVTKPSEMALRLGLPVAEVYDGLKRFRRKLAAADAAVARADNEHPRTST